MCLTPYTGTVFGVQNKQHFSGKTLRHYVSIDVYYIYIYKCDWTLEEGDGERETIIYHLQLPSWDDYQSLISDVFFKTVCAIWRHIHINGDITLVGGLEHGFYFSIYWECHHPNWRTHVFQRGRYTTNQLHSTFLDDYCLVVQTFFIFHHNYMG